MKKRLMNDLKESMKNKDEITKNTIQLVRARILNEEKDKQIEYKDNEILSVIASEIKKRKDTLNDFGDKFLPFQIEQLNKEIEILNKYMPAAATREEIEEEVKSILSTLDSPKMGEVIKTVKAKFGVAADGKLISEVVKSLLK